MASLLAELAAYEKRLTARLEGAPAKCSVKCPDVFSSVRLEHNRFVGSCGSSAYDDERVFDAWPIFDEERIFDGEPIFDEDPNGSITECVDVSCHGNGSVQGLQLERLGLAGSVPDLDALAMLLDPRALSLFSNEFSSPVPEFFTSPRLLELLLANNSFEGSLPDIFGAHFPAAASIFPTGPLRTWQRRTSEAPAGHFWRADDEARAPFLE